MAVPRQGYPPVWPPVYTWPPGPRGTPTDISPYRWPHRTAGHGMLLGAHGKEGGVHGRELAVHWKEPDAHGKTQNVSKRTH